MTEKKQPPSLDDFDARLREARQRLVDERGRDVPQVSRNKFAGGLGLAFRIGTELVAGVGVGAGIGYALDRWLGTGPWLMVVFFFLGSAAGILNVYRAMGEIARRSDDQGP